MTAGPDPRRVGCGARPARPALSGLLGLLALTACAAPSSFGGGGEAGPLPGALPPPGHGTLRQDDVTVTLRSGPLQIKVTPLAESVTRVTAPDTYRRLSGLAAAHATGGAPRDERVGEGLFLVSFFSDEPNVTFVPEDLYLLAQGLRLRHTRIRPLTPGWGGRRLRQRETEMAVYDFGPVDLESNLVVVYSAVESAQWSRILPRVQVERARARARAGVGAPYTSSSYFEILR